PGQYVVHESERHIPRQLSQMPGCVQGSGSREGTGGHGSGALAGQRDPRSRKSWSVSLLLPGSRSPSGITGRSPSPVTGHAPNRLDERPNPFDFPALGPGPKHSPPAGNGSPPSPLSPDSRALPRQGPGRRRPAALRARGTRRTRSVTRRPTSNDTRTLRENHRADQPPNPADGSRSTSCI